MNKTIPKNKRLASSLAGATRLSFAFILAVAAYSAVGAPELLVGPIDLRSNDDLVVAGNDGVETTGSIKISESAILIIATDGNSRITIGSGFHAEPGAGGQVVAYITGSQSELDSLIALMDRDDDGMLDDYESYYHRYGQMGPFPTPYPGELFAANEDLDGDGLTNLQEFLLGSMANVEFNGLIVTSDQTIRFYAVADVSYRVEYSSGSTWSTLGFPIAGDNTIVDIDVSSFAAAGAQFRLINTINDPALNAAQEKVYAELTIVGFGE